MNKYKAFFNGRTTEVESETAYSAQQKAVEFFKPAKSKKHMVHVVLKAKSGQPVIHSTSSI